MKIKDINYERILFDDGSSITYDHERDCCEINYADFEQLDDIARECDFSKPLTFEAIDGAGFRFGNEGRMFFVPCYSEQNGYYTRVVDIYFNDEKVLCLICEEILD